MDKGYLVTLDSQVSALLAQAKNHCQYFDEAEGNMVPIQKSLGAFHAFFTDYNNYFRQWERVQDCASKGVPHQYVLATALEKTREAWNALNWAVTQRYNPTYRAMLEKADSVAQTLYQRFTLYEQNRVPITYFDKQSHITRFPYGANPLIAVPLGWISDLHSAIPEIAESAIAHELGHHIFWNADNLDGYTLRMKRLQQMIARRVTGLEDLSSEAISPLISGDNKVQGVATIRKYIIWSNWAEETFADVFGCLLRGPAFAVAAQDLRVLSGLRNSADLIDDDGLHPMAYLRPLISLQVLVEIANVEGVKDANFGAALRHLIDVLRIRWEPYRTAIPHTEISDGVFPGDLEEYVEAIVWQFVHSLKFEEQSLMESVTYWGKGSKKQWMKEVEEILNNVEPLPQPFTVTMPGSYGRYPANAPDSEVPSEDFVVFAQFIQSQPVPEDYTIKLEVWESLLYLDLLPEANEDDNDCQDRKVKRLGSSSYYVKSSDADAEYHWVRRTGYFYVGCSS